MKTALKTALQNLQYRKNQQAQSEQTRDEQVRKKTVFDVKAMSYSFHLHPFDGQFTGNYQSKAWILQA